MPPFRRALILATFVMSLGGFMLHMRIHPVYVKEFWETKQVNGVSTQAKVVLPPGTQTVPENLRVKFRFSLEHLFAILIGLVDVVVVTALFCSIGTVSIAYLLKGMCVIFGTVFMAHFSISELSHGPHPFTDWILKSTLSDILILWAGFFIGKAIYDSYTLAAPETPAPRGISG